MGLYSSHILPQLVHWTCGLKPFMRQRAKVVPLAQGTILDVGIGSGHNLSYYDPGRAQRVIGLDPSAAMTRKARRAARSTPLDVLLLMAGAESIPLPARSVDSALLTFTLCTIPDPAAALAEIARVLRPGAQLLFCEHGRAPDENVRKWQDRVTPIWRRLAGGCHLNRDVPALLAQAGFRISWIESAYMPGWRPASFHYWGTAGAPA